MKLTDKISENFTYGEVIRSPLAAGLGMSNDLPIELLPKIQLLTKHILEPTRLHFNKPIIITSWWRCKALNQMISNNLDSQHTKAEAVDWKVQDVNNLKVAEWIRDNLVFDQLILERSWIHTSYVDYRLNREEVLTCYDSRTYKKGLK